MLILLPEFPASETSKFLMVPRESDDPEFDTYSLFIIANLLIIHRIWIEVCYDSFPE